MELFEFPAQSEKLHQRPLPFFPGVQRCLIQMAAGFLPLSIGPRPLLSGLHYSPRQIRILQTALAAKSQPSSPRAGQKSNEVRGHDELKEHEGLPEEFFDDEWQAQQREKTREWHAYRKKEEEKENRKDEEYREIGLRLKGYPEEEVREARKLVSSFIRAEGEVEAKIEEAAEKGELTELVLMVIWNRLDLARRDEEKDVIRSLDLLYRRVETEILKREATASMRLLDDLLNLYDGHDYEGWLKKCRKRMIDTFPREDPFSILTPAGFDINNHQGHIGLLHEDDDLLLRVDFIREVDELLQEVKAENRSSTPQGLDPESVAARLKLQEKKQTIHQVESLLELAMTLKW